MKAGWWHCVFLSWVFFQPTHVDAHNVDELTTLFEPTPVPQELMEAAKELDATAGMKSIREEAHNKQHALLHQYIKALADKQCRESLDKISGIDREIVEARDKGSAETEQKLREQRRDTAGFVDKKCTGTQVETILQPQH